VRSILGGLIPQLAAASATSASVRGDIDPPSRRRNRKIHLHEIFLTHQSKNTEEIADAPLQGTGARAHTHVPKHGKHGFTNNVEPKQSIHREAP
jgi:hypothetical protein